MVSDPVKQGEGMQAYVSYRVATKTSLPQYRWAEFSVIRRFRDFAWLQSRLMDRNPGIIIPPVPEKNVVAKYSFNADFIERRRAALQVFLNRCAEHPTLRQSADLQLFLEANEEVWAAEANSGGAGGAVDKKVSRLGLSLKSLGQSVSRALHISTPDASVESTLTEDPEYERTKAYIRSLVSHLDDAHREAAGLVKQQKEQADVLARFGTSVILLGNTESGKLGNAFSELGNQADSLSVDLARHAETTGREFEAPLKEWALTAASVKKVMQARSVALLELETAAESVNMRSGKLKRLQATVNTPPDKITGAERDLQDANRKHDAAKEHYEYMKSQMAKELVRFQEQKANDLAKVMADFTKTQANNCRVVADAWGSLVPRLEQLQSQQAAGAE